MALGIQSILDALLEQVWFELTFLLAVSLLAGFIFARFGQPKVLGYIIVGVVIGPSLLGIIQPSEESISGLPESIMMLAELGAIILLFMIGLECDLKDIFTTRSIAIALGGVLVPWAVGYEIAVLFGYGVDAIFVGATLVATSVAVTASVISELGMIGTPVAYAIMGAAVVDDILGMIVLAIARGASGGETLVVGDLVLLVVGAILFLVVGGWIGSKFLVRLVFNVQVSGYRRRLPLSGFTLALAIAFLYAFIAETMQISAIVGAFVAGMVFANSALRDGFRKGMQYLEAVFVPLFFVSLGTVVSLGEIWNEIWFGIVLTVAAVLSKIVGCGVPALFTKMSRYDSLAVGVGMAPRMEIALIIAYYGLSNNIIEENVYSVVVFMGLMTAVFAPWMLKKVLKRGGHKVVEL